MSLILDHVTYEYGSDTELAVKALDNIELVIDDNEFLGLIGHTGSGKSTLVQHLNGLLKPTSGHIYFNGRDIHENDFDRRALRGEVGLVFQYPEHQLFELTVFKDVCFGPKNMGMKPEQCEVAAYEALEAVGLDEELYDQSPLDLSGGQKRRVAIAGVLAMHPKVLVLDEPTAGLDPKGRDEILDLVKELKKNLGMTIVLVSHSMDDVAEYADKIVVMDRGKIIYHDTPKNVFAHAKELEAMGLGVPQVTSVMKSLADAGIDVPQDITTVDEAADVLAALCK
ncbi:MAG: energy-coupling factor transporter ATPase [Lachnospiraceae bacterium]|nr:energy-coupling factor transporter ATPase [Lachnospiraceae bacterium]